MTVARDKMTTKDLRKMFEEEALPFPLQPTKDKSVDHVYQIHYAKWLENICLKLMDTIDQCKEVMMVDTD